MEVMDRLKQSDSAQLSPQLFFDFLVRVEYIYIDL